MSFTTLFFEAFKLGLSGFSLKREIPRAPIVFQLEPQPVFILCEKHPSLRSRFVVSGAYLLPSFLFVVAAILIEAALPISFIYSDLLSRVVASSEAILLGAILFEAVRVFQGSLGAGLRYIVLASLTAIVLTMAAVPNASILLICGVYAGLHSYVDKRLRQPKTLNLEALVMLLPMGLVVLGSWGSPWTGLALLSDVWSDKVLSGQLARSCLWAAFGPAVLPVLLLHLAYSVSEMSGLFVTLLGLWGITIALSGGSSRRATKTSYHWLWTAFHGGFLPALALLTIGSLSTWPLNIQWDALHSWIVLLGFALRARGWNLKILVSLALAILSLQTIVERL